MNWPGDRLASIIPVESGSSTSAFCGGAFIYAFIFAGPIVFCFHWLRLEFVTLFFSMNIFASFLNNTMLTLYADATV